MKNYYLSFLAIAQLKYPIEMSGGLSSSICLPDNNIPIPDESDCFMSGWGDENGQITSKLKSVAMLTVSKDVCNLPGNFDSAVDETQMCAGVNEKDGGVCADDKGGSLICPKDSKSLRW